MESFSDIHVGVDPNEVSENCDAIVWGDDESTKHWGDVEEIIGSVVKCHFLISDKSFRFEALNS